MRPTTELASLRVPQEKLLEIVNIIYAIYDPPGLSDHRAQSSFFVPSFLPFRSFCEQLGVDAPLLPHYKRCHSGGDIAAAFLCRHITPCYSRSGRNPGTEMANTKSAKKATRKIARRTEVNKARRSRMRTSLRRVEDAIASGNKAAAKSALVAAEPALMRAARTGIIHKKSASRKVSRLTLRIAKLGN